jgi:hypothetical protein
MGVFKGIEEAKATEGGNYLKPGIYDVEIVRLKVGKTRKGVAFFASDLRVIGSNNPDHRVGEIVNWFVGFDKDAALGNVKAFATAVLSGEAPVDPQTVTEQVMEAMVDKGGEDVAGTRLKVQVTLVDTKGGGKFSRHLWFPAGAQIAA